MAPPSKLTPEVQERICQLVRVGNTVEIAANAAGITTVTYDTWMQTRKGFRLAVEGARAEAEAILVGRVQKAASAGSWRAACWLLERQWPERWAPLADRAKLVDELDRELDQILAGEGVDPVRFIVDYCGVELREFQRDWLSELFRESDGVRAYSQALWGVPRGNGKTEIAAAIALYMLVADCRRAEVYIAAGSRDQASLAFKAARRMVEGGPLESVVKVLPGYRRMVVPKTDSSLHVISADGPLQHGLQPSCVIFDELWVQKKRDLFEALAGGLFKRDRALLICISTAGYSQDSLLAEECERGELGSDPRFFYRWHSAPTELPYQDPETWRAANPALSCEKPFMRVKGLEDDLRRMHESEFRRWHLNQWTAAEDAWMDARLWDGCDGMPELVPGRDTILGIDASIRHDMTVVATVQRDDDGTYHAIFRSWGPEKEIDLGLVMRYVREQAEAFSVTGVAYDPQYMHHPAKTLEDEGLPMVEWKQDNGRMVPATRTLYEAVVHGRLRHGNDRMARSHALAAGVAETERGLRLKKTEVTRGKYMDAMVALAMAVDWASRTAVVKRSVYEDRYAAA